MITNKFNIALEQMMGKGWELYEYERSFSPDYKYAISKTIELSYGNVTADGDITTQLMIEMQDIIKNLPEVKDLVRSHKSDIEDYEQTISDLKEEIEDLNEYKTYYNMHKKMITSEKI